MNQVCFNNGSFNEAFGEKESAKNVIPKKRMSSRHSAVVPSNDGFLRIAAQVRIGGYLACLVDDYETRRQGFQ